MRANHLRAGPPRRRRPPGAAIALGIALAASPAIAQDTQNWTRTYGPVSTLLGGVVVGSVSDLSATFYNPGALSLAEDPRFTLSLDSLESSQVTSPNGAGPGIALESGRLATAPSFFAGDATPRWMKGGHLGYAFLTRSDLDVRVEARRIFAPPAATAAQADVAAASASIVLESRLTEVWGGVTWSHRLGQRLGVGVSQFVAIRNQNQRFEAVATSVATAGESGATALVDESFEYWHVRTLWKLGVAYHGSRFRAGMALTTPGVALSGNGRAAVTRSSVAPGSGELTASAQARLPAAYRNPWSVAVGASYRVRGTTVHAATEWFSAVGTYEVVSGAPTTSYPSGTVRTPRLTTALTSVVAFGAGVQQALGRGVLVYASATKDPSSLDRSVATSLSVSSWDIVSLQAGATFPVGRVDWAFGLGYAFGRDEVPPLASLDQVTPGTALDPGPGAVEVRYSSLRLLFGLTFGSR